jgi:hypothetical protein
LSIFVSGARRTGWGDYGIEYAEAWDYRATPMTGAWQLWLAGPEAERLFDPEAQSFEDRRRWARAAAPQRSTEWAVSRALLAHVAPGGRARSLSHSGGFAALAVGPAGSRLGVDLERVDRRRDPLRLARFAFDAREVAQLEALSGPAREERFYTLWTLKEAAIKALGHPLLPGLRRCVFTERGGRWSVRLPGAESVLSAQVFRPRSDVYIGALVLGEAAILWRELEWPAASAARWERIDFDFDPMEDRS